MRPEVIVALIMAGGSLLAALFNIRKSAKKDELDILRGIMEELRCEITELKKENGELHAEIDQLKMENIDLKDWAQRLVNQAKERGWEPVPFIHHKRTKNNPNEK